MSCIHFYFNATRCACRVFVFFFHPWPRRPHVLLARVISNSMHLQAWSCTRTCSEHFMHTVSGEIAVFLHRTLCSCYVAFTVLLLVKGLSNKRSVCYCIWKCKINYKRWQHFNKLALDLQLKMTRCLVSWPATSLLCLSWICSLWRLVIRCSWSFSIQSETKH